MVVDGRIPFMMGTWAGFVDGRIPFMVTLIEDSRIDLKYLEKVLKKIQ